MIISGRVSFFGGPFDAGTKRGEGLACIEPPDLKDWWFRRCFLEEQPKGTSGLIRRLDHYAYYLAIRFTELGLTRAEARGSVFKLSSEHGWVFAQCVDWGPHEKTGRVIDVSLGCLSALQVVTDQIVRCELVLRARR